ncbi:MAG: alanyl-tRNA editing protein [Bryobacteraceae bacterium]
MQLQPTERLYWHDDHCFAADAAIIGAQDGALAFDRTCFYPGGGGQPADEGTVTLADGEVLNVVAVRVDDEDVFWHLIPSAAPAGIVGQQVKLNLNSARRLSLMRHHTVLHVLNTIALRDYAGWITGVQIGAEYSRIDFKLEGFSAAMCAELEAKVNGILNVNHPLRSYYLAEDEFRNRKDLLRTLEVKPPVVNGRVRVVEIEGFDAQACGGTHVASTAEVGRLSIFRTENKGKINKRLYIRLD